MLYVFAIAYSITIRLKIIFQYFHWVRKCIFAESLLLTQGPMKCSQTFIFVRKVIKPCAAGQKLCFFPSGSLERDFKTTNKNLVSASQSLLNTAGNYMFKVNNRNTVTRCEICSKFSIKTPEQRHWRHSAVFAANFKHISHLVLVFQLLTLNRWVPAGKPIVWSTVHFLTSFNLELILKTLSRKCP